MDALPVVPVSQADEVGGLGRGGEEEGGWQGGGGEGEEYGGWVEVVRGRGEEEHSAEDGGLRREGKLKGSQLSLDLGECQNDDVTHTYDDVTHTCDDVTHHMMI